MKQLVLLGIFAHPDDESFGPGGTLARYAAEGTAVHVCTLTDGAAGTADPDCWDCLEGYEDLAERRVEELRCAVEILGGQLHFMGYRDSGMTGDPANDHPDAFINQPLDEVAGRLTRLIRELRPDIIVTHDETGNYFHPDHIYTYQAAVAAFHAAGERTRYPEQLTDGLAPFDPPSLYAYVIPRTYIQFFIWLARLSGQDPSRFGRNQDIDLTKVGKADDQIHVRLPVREYLRLKSEASACHGSQGGGGGLSTRAGPTLRDRITFWLRRWFNNWESFQQLYPEPNGRRHDLFRPRNQP
jgi:LmbE family N-acetylglucosaminyl deacetylase